MNTSTLEKMRKMKFFGMFHAFKSSMATGKTNDHTADELLALLVDAEWDDRQNWRIEERYNMPSSAMKPLYRTFITMPKEVSTAIRSCAWQTALSLTAMKTYWLPVVPALVKAMWLLLSATRPVCSATGYSMPVRLSCSLN